MHLPTEPGIAGSSPAGIIMLPFYVRWKTLSFVVCDTYFVAGDTYFFAGDTYFVAGDTYFVACDTYFVAGDTYFVVCIASSAAALNHNGGCLNPINMLFKLRCW